MSKHIAISFILFISIFLGVLTAHCAVDELNSLRAPNQQLSHIQADSSSHEHNDATTSDANHNVCHTGNCLAIIQSNDIVLISNPNKIKSKLISVSLVHFKSLLYRPPIS